MASDESQILLVCITHRSTSNATHIFRYNSAVLDESSANQE